jgi:hypothetical protein
MKTKEEVKHTPTPWSAELNDGTWDIRHANGTVAMLDKYDDETEQANAAFIVRAVNSHAALLEAAKEIVQDIREDNDLGDTFKKLVEAIALAEGKI